MRRFVLALGFTLALVAGRGAAQAPAAEPVPAEAPWKPFQEFGAVIGSWSGTADSAGRIGGTVGRWTQEMSGNFLVHHVNTIFPAQSGKPEESIELVGYYAYDREKRKYVASYFFFHPGDLRREFSATRPSVSSPGELLNYGEGPFAPGPHAKIRHGADARSRARAPGKRLRPLLHDKRDS